MAVILFFYGEAVFSWSRIQAEPAEILFLSGIRPEKEEAEKLLETMNTAQPEASVCFLWDGGLETVTEPEYGRSTEVMTMGILGPAGLYDSRIHGFSGSDQEGCVLDEAAAQELFGTRKAQGRVLCLNGASYQVRQVLPWNQKLLLVSQKETSQPCDRAFLKKENSPFFKSAEQFFGNYGLQGMAADGNFLQGTAFLFLLPLPAAVLLFLFFQALQQRKKEEKKGRSFWLWTGALVLPILTAGLFLFVKLRIPGEWIPSRWSDFSFWADNIRKAGENLRWFLFLPKTAIQAENLLCFFRTVVFSLTAFGAAALLPREKFLIEIPEKM